MADEKKAAPKKEDQVEEAAAPAVPASGSFQNGKFVRAGKKAPVPEKPSKKAK